MPDMSVGASLHQLVGDGGARKWAQTRAEGQDACDRDQATRGHRQAAKDEFRRPLGARGTSWQSGKASEADRGEQSELDKDPPFAAASQVRNTCHESILGPWRYPTPKLEEQLPGGRRGG